jgi:hypothetical protein
VLQAVLCQLECNTQNLYIFSTSFMIRDIKSREVGD